MATGLRRFVLRLRNSLRYRRAEEELAREVAAHLALLEDAYRARGMAPDEARLAARRAMGGVEQAKERHRDARAFSWIDDGRRDALQAVRSLHRHRRFAALAILTVGLGIGASTAVYTAFDAAFLRPLPFADPGRLVQVSRVSVPLLLDGLSPPPGDRGGSAAPPRCSVLCLEDLQAHRDVFSRAAAHATGAANLGSGPEPLRVDVTFVTGDFFATLGRGAALGRVFAPEEMTGGGANVTVLSERLWRTHFGGDPTIVGNTVMLDAVPYQVIGVMPRDFRFPAQAQLWVPLPVPVPTAVLSAFRNFLPTVVVARLASGISAELAAERLDAIRQQYLAASPRNPNLAGRNQVTPLQRSLVGDRRSALLVLMGSAALVLLIACANTATLLLSRAAARRREMATHAALGAARGRILRRLLMESLVLAGAGGVVGLALAYSSVSVLAAVVPAGLAGPAPPQIDLRVIMFVTALALGTAVLFGLWPAIGASRIRFAEALRDAGSGRFTSSRRLDQVLVVVQVAIACVLVTGAALMQTSLRSLLATDVGMQIERVATARLNLPPAQYPDRAALAGFIQSTLASLAGAAGVEQAAAINTLPLAGESGIALRVQTESGTFTGTDVADAAPYLMVSPGYFTTMGIPLRQGRDLVWDDGSDVPVAVINRTAARRYWPGEDALGKRFTFMGGPGRTVVGVVDDARIGDLTAAVGPQVYLPIQEQPQNYLSLVARSTEAVRPGALVSQIRAAVRNTDPSVPVYAAQPLPAVVSERLAGRRTDTLVITAFGLLALCLAAIGVYGVVACAVAQRTREIGIRMALGAERSRVLVLVLRQGVVLVTAGITLGVIAALAAARTLEGMLYGVAPRDPTTLLVAVLVLGAVGLFASFIPAHRAASANPLVALRND